MVNVDRVCSRKEEEGGGGGACQRIFATESTVLDNLQSAVYTNYFYDTSVIFSNFIITYKEPFIGPT